MKISACIIAMDEADRILPCLESVAFCDEVLVVDSGSRDGTPDLCRRSGARVVETDWPGWVAQKNRAADLATHDWILSVDADERVDPALREEIERIRDQHADADTGAGAGAGADPGSGATPIAYEVTRKVWYLGRWIRHGGWYPEWRVRLFDRRHARWGGVDPHDRLEPRGRVARIHRGNLEHVTYRSLSDHVAQMNRFASVAAEGLIERGRGGSLATLVLRPPARFLRMYVLQRGFLDGWRGFVLASMGAWYVFLKYAKVRERLRAGAPRVS